MACITSEIYSVPLYSLMVSTSSLSRSTYSSTSYLRIGQVLKWPPISSFTFLHRVLLLSPYLPIMHNMAYIHTPWLVPQKTSPVANTGLTMACIPDMRTCITHLCLIVLSAPKQPLTSVTSEASGSYVMLVLH